MNDIDELLKEAAGLEARLRPMVAQPVKDPASTESLLRTNDALGVGVAEARSLLLRFLPHYERASGAERQALREALHRYPSFGWAAVPPGPIRSKDDLRVHILAFSLLDQPGDPRDEFSHLVAICRQAQAAKLPVRRMLLSVARLSSMKNRGAGSTWTLMCWAAAWPFRYGSEDHDKYLRA